jgi:hypothetical protein
MDKSQLYWLFLGFIGEESIDIGGLYLKPERILRDGNTMEFSIQNPNDISFYLEVVKELLDDLMYDFSKFTNHKFKIHVDTNYPELYFNKKLKTDITKVLKSIKTLKLSNPTNNPSARNVISVEITGRSVDFNAESNMDSISIWNEFDAESGIVYNRDNGTILHKDLGECIDYYFQTIESDSAYLESDEVYKELDTVLSDHPLIDGGWVTQSYHTGFRNLF